MITTKLLAAVMMTACCVGFSSCKTTKPDMTYVPEPPQPRTLGSVVFADASEGFVLVRMDYGYTAEAGTTVYAMSGPSATARLVVAPEKQRQFLVANIDKGKAATGQAVVFFPEPDKAPKL